MKQNKLFIIRWFFRGKAYDTWCGTTEKAAREKMSDECTWDYALVSDTDDIQVWEARQ